MPRKKRYRQTGKTSKAHDIKRHAKKPGVRRSKSRKKYTEHRRNRSDKGRWL
ncbi:MAG: hypothetical protein HY555_04050 [Euryarchaeota archaeon]|nr:hypothetical protein [Euryarchaeota archaeon]